jgi:hypothetical protein
MFYDYDKLCLAYIIWNKLCEVFSLENGIPTTATKDDKNITYIEKNGRTFVIAEHFTGTNTYLDIVKNALRREAELDSKSK